MDLWFQEKIQVLAEELRHSKSIDGYLVKLSSLVYDLEDYCYGNVERARELFEKTLKHPLIANELRALSCYRDVVEASIQRDPRIKKLREYADILARILSEIPCREEKRLSISREATFRVEEAETRKEEKAVVRSTRRTLLIKMLMATGVILLIVALAIIVLMTFM
ncbi:MAG: hypothetical protein QXH02_03995 [Desulfurococcaceae archaeon]